MRRTHFFAAFLAVVLALGLGQHSAAANKNKNRNWENGKLLDSERNRYLARTVGTASAPLPGAGDPDGPFATFPKTTNSSQRAVYRNYQTFLIEGSQYVYLAQERFRGKPANLTVNGPVKFAVEKQTLFVVDEDGKEHEMEIIKKSLRQETPK